MEIVLNRFSAFQKVWKQDNLSCASCIHEILFVVIILTALNHHLSVFKSSRSTLIPYTRNIVDIFLFVCSFGQP